MVKRKPDPPADYEMRTRYNASHLPPNLTDKEVLERLELTAGTRLATIALQTYKERRDEKWQYKRSGS